LGVRRPTPCTPSHPGQESVVHAETAEGRRGAEEACEPTDVCERFALGFATAMPLPIRHAELVSASMLRRALSALAACAVRRLSRLARPSRPALSLSKDGEGAAQLYGAASGTVAGAVIGGRTLSRYGHGRRRCLLRRGALDKHTALLLRQYLHPMHHAVAKILSEI